MDARYRHNGQRDKRTNGRTDEKTRRVSSSVRPSVGNECRGSWGLRSQKL